jgi:RNA 2',3'-cyclic 3'-phosphodiesterase
MKRLFAAVKVHPDTSFFDPFRRMKSQLGYEKIKWVEEDNLHITLKFFGETEEHRIPFIVSALDTVSTCTAGFHFRLEGIGVFGSRYNPRVIWVGIRPYEPLVSLMQAIGEELKSIGFQPDRQNPVPHLTVGRIKEVRDKQIFQKVIDENNKIISGEMMADEFHLYESILKKEGPVYLDLQTFSLRPEGGSL